MHFPRPWSGRLLTAVLSAAVAMLLVGWAGPVMAQKSGAAPAQAPKAKAPLAGTLPPPVTFAALAQAVTQQDHTVVRLRRFIDPQGQIVAVREQLQVDADGSDTPPFVLSFLGVEGELPGSPAHTKWQQTYHRHGPLFEKHGSFGVRDLAKVQQNYSLHDFGLVVRAGRQAQRTVVFPLSVDKSIWVVDVDAATKVPLCWAEFDFQFRLLGEVEALTFVDSVALSAPIVTSAAVHADFSSAKAALGDPAGLVEPPGVLANYAVSAIETRDDPLNGQQKLVMTYTDGVDQFLVVQTPGTTDVFASLLPMDKGGKSSLGHTIGRFQDSAMRVLLFWEDGVSFQVAGRGSLARLDNVAHQLFLQALSTN